MTNDELRKVFLAFSQLKGCGLLCSERQIETNKDNKRYIDFIKNTICEWEEAERILFKALCKTQTKPQE